MSHFTPATVKLWKGLTGQHQVNVLQCHRKLMKHQEMKRAVVVGVILLPCSLRSTDSFSSPCDLVLAPTAFSPSGRESYSDPGTAGGALWVITQRHCGKEKHTGREEEKEKVCVSSEITANKRRAWLLNTVKPQILRPLSGQAIPILQLFVPICFMIIKSTSFLWSYF